LDIISPIVTNGKLLDGLSSFKGIIKLLLYPNIPIYYTQSKIGKSDNYFLNFIKFEKGRVQYCN